MKTKLFILAALLIIMTFSVCASPAPADVVDTVSEEAQEPYTSSESTADVMAEASVVPGKNVYTGDTNVMTFDGFTESDLGAMFSWPTSFSMTVAEDATNGTVIKGSYPSTSTSEGWVTFYSPISYKINRRAFYYINYKLDPGSVGHVTGKDELESYSWVINLVNLAGDKKNFGIPVTTMGSWLTATNDNEQYIWGDKLHSFNMKFAPGGNVYVDNYALIPYYQITYKNIDKNGNSLGDDIVTYFLTDDTITVSDSKINGIATSYKVENKVLSCNDDTVIFSGWSTTQGGNPEPVVALNNSDVVLYPVWTSVDKKVVVYEDFEDVADGTILRKYADELDANNNPVLTIYNAFNMNVKPNSAIGSATLNQGDQAADMTIVKLADGNTVLKVAKAATSNSKWRMVTFHLFTANSTGLTAAQPGKYKLTCRYYIDENDPSSYSSISGRIGVDGDFIFPGKGASVSKGAWHAYTQEFEIKKDGTICYGSNVKAFTNPIYRFDFVNNYGDNTMDVLYYLDDIKVTYDKAYDVTVNYVDSTGKTIKSVGAINYENEGVLLTTASALGLDYDVVYTVNGKKYYPGQKVVLGANATSVDVKVSNTNVIYYESFDSREIDSKGSFGINPEYIAPIYSDVSYTPTLTGGDSGSAQSYKTTTESGRNVLAIKRFQQGSGLYSMYMESRFLGTGTYYYTVTYKASGSTLSGNDMNMQTKNIEPNTNNINFAVPLSSFPADEDGYRTVTYEIKVYDDADGVRKADFTNVPNKDYSEKTFNRIMFYWWGPKEENSNETIYLDEVSIEYKPFAPGEVNLKGYRDVAPIGIRFASYVTDAQKTQSTEYGFIVTRKLFLENAATAAGTGTYADYLYIENDDVIGTSTTLVTNNDGVAIVGAAAYNDKVNRVYATDGSYFESSKYIGLNDAVTFFTGVVSGITSDEQKAETFVVRPYIKVDGVYYFGTTYEASFNDVYDAANG